MEVTRKPLLIGARVLKLASIATCVLQTGQKYFFHKKLMLTFQKLFTIVWWHKPIVPAFGRLRPEV
jgi:hypothetical protein